MYFNRVFFSNDGGIDTFTFPPPHSLSLFLVASFIWTSIWNYEWSYCWLFIIGCWTGKTRKQLTPWPSDKAGLYFSVVWMIITNFPYVSVLPWKILPSHRLKNLTIVLVETSLALGTTSCINTTRTNSTTVYTIWGIYGTSEKVRQLPTFFCCHCFSWCSVKNACSFVNDYEYFSRREESGA